MPSRSFIESQQQPDSLHSDFKPNAAGVVHFDFGFTSDKVHGNQPVHRAPSSHPSNDSFDEAYSSTSSNTSNSSSACAPPTRLNGDDSAGNTSIPADMTSATAMSNGKPGAGEKLSHVETTESFYRKPLVNGVTTTTLVDRTVSSTPNQQQQYMPPPAHSPPEPPRQRISNGMNHDDQKMHVSAAHRDSHLLRASMTSTNGESIPPTPVDMYMKPMHRADVVTLDTSTASAPSHNFSNPTSPTPATPERNGVPHRFSSPPHYNSNGGTPSSSSAGLAPPGAALKHRHTLEVPKVGPSRGSRDGPDAAYTSGRFSPTNTPTGGRRASLSLVRRNTRSLHSDMPRDEIIPDDDALRWAEAYRQKRASKRKRLEEDDDRVVIGNKVDEKHTNWVAAYNMLTGIRVSVSRTNAKLDRALTDEDFQTKQKSTFDVAGNELVPSAKYDFKFKDYAPWVFRRLRAIFGLDPADYLMSLTGKYILSELGSPGKSGSFFYFSRDYKYIIKTIHHSEHKFLRKILKDYYEHATENPNTLLSQFYGLHRVKVAYGRKIHFVVMNNLFPPHRDIHQTFDLKGSTIGRDYKEDNLGQNPRATLKDLNWLRRKKHLELGIQKKQLFLEQLRKDVKLLQKLKIMDYSLLIGIHDLQRGNEENLRHKTLQVFNPGGSAGPDEPDPAKSVLLRTPSKLENQRKARELRQMIKSERPIPMGEGSSTMPNELEQGVRSDSVFYKDDGGFQATHEDNSPGEEIYYLGVIDCLTHYGFLKKIEHFWKGLSHDRTQISPVPPEEYGDRFINFMSGITMSPEEVERETQERDARMQAAAAVADAQAAAAQEDREKGKERVSSWNSNSRSKTNAIPPVPSHQPPPIPGSKSPEVEDVVRRAEHEAFKHPEREQEVPDMILRTTTDGPMESKGSTAPGSKVNGSASTASERREPAQPAAILPVVEEAGEASSMGGRSRSRVSNRSDMSSHSERRPVTPAKDRGRSHGFSVLSALKGNQKGLPPPTPPKSSHLKPESADSGYGVVGGGGHIIKTGRVRSNSDARSTKGSISRESLDKALPPLPT
ncbi:hypothetical protein MCOR02_008404 [Pyricularia oryzae]|nr:hypothetical protein MCOR02_008404 [Pyricularia oryzae]KAI6464843.1 hypothetical protein MCOR17_005196 [Pyricularia oryzae]KAI6510333.1 hypothetical protein MCOR13_001095 [Pyricularia oryzae]KAI6607392.1 hypothetical protein MCOR04_000624 [Pyricularia oryzae]KAI6640892.1 hypothetical protein MCOR14_003243 [Pyricularia oryzae]